MLLRNSTIIILLFAALLTAQQRKGIHQEHNELYGRPNAEEASNPEKTAAILPLNTNAEKELSHIVFGYLPDWEYGSSHQYIRYDLLTHIGCFDFTVNTSGIISNPPSWPWTDLINKAHNAGTKVIMVVANFNAGELNTILNNELVKQRFFGEVRQKLETYQLDGVNIDFESIGSGDRGEVLNTFMAELTEYIHTELPGKEVSFAGPMVNWGGWDLDGLAASCDYVFIMGYALFGSWSSTTGPNAPVTGGTYNLTTSLDVQYQATTQNTPEKLVLGLPYYGLQWKASAGGPGASTSSFVNSPRIEFTLNAAKQYNANWSSTYQNPYYSVDEGFWRQVWYDDDSSTALKYRLVKDRGIAGTGMWALGYDGANDVMWNLIDRFFGSGTPPPDRPWQFSVRYGGETSLTVVCSESERAEAYRVYYGTDPVALTDSVDAASNTIEVTGLDPNTVYYFKVAAVNQYGVSFSTGLLAGQPSAEPQRILFVDGFDRTRGTVNKHDYVKRFGPHISAAGTPFVSATNEAVAIASVNLEDFDAVIYMLGEESTTFEAFNPYEESKLAAYLRAGGKLFVSGSEIGWDIGRSSYASPNDMVFYNKYLKAEYINDAPLGVSSKYYTLQGISGGPFESVNRVLFDNGSYGAYDVDWPDAIRGYDGGQTTMQFYGVPYASNGGSAVAYTGPFGNSTEEGAVVYMTAGFETIRAENDRDLVMAAALEYFGVTPTSVEDGIASPASYALAQNYPNPFNPSTTIEFTLAEDGPATIRVFSVLGEEVMRHAADMLPAGTHAVPFDGEGLAGGVYIYTLSSGDFYASRKMLLLK